MTRSDKITEFLKYASPRLGYIEHCMEKQALSPQLLLTAGRAARRSGRLGNMKHLRGAVTNSKGKLLRKSQIEKNLANRYKNYTKGSFSNVTSPKRVAPTPVPAPALTQAAVEEMITKTMPYKGLPTQGTGELLRITPEQTALRAATNAVPDATVNKVLSTWGIPTKGTGEMLLLPEFRSMAATPLLGKGIPGLPSGAAKAKAAADNVAKVGVLDSVGNWVAKHPTAALLGTAGGTGALAGGIGYGMGNSSGQKEGAEAAAQIFALQQALMQQRLQQANSSIGSRFMNLFGAGALNDLIG